MAKVRLRSKSVMFIGVERLERASLKAIEVGYKSGQEVTAGDLTRYTLDNFLELAAEKLLSELNEARLDQPGVTA